MHIEHKFSALKSILLFVFLSFFFSWSFWGLRILSQQNILPSVFSLIGQLGIFGPFIAFLILSKSEKYLLKDRFKRLFSGTIPRWVMIFSILVPLFLSFISYMILVYFTDIPFRTGLSLQMIIPVAFLILFVGGPIEEFGWRGWLHPKLREHLPMFYVTIIIGLIHGLWHLPLHFIDGTVQQAIPIYQFLVITILTTLSYAFIYEFTHHLLPMILLHWFSNVGSAIFVYWQIDFGRYIFFSIILIFDIILGILYVNHHHKSIKKESEQ